MMKHSVKLLALLGIFGAAALANDAMAMTSDECEQLSGNMFLAAIERGECDVSIQTAAGPEVVIPADEPPHNTRDGRNGGEGGGGGGGGEHGGSSGRAGPVGR
jgi:hypothetical protein